MDGSVKQYSSTGIKTLMEASATLPQAIDSLQSSTNCHLSFDCGPGQMISQEDRRNRERRIIAKVVFIAS
jgi:hypothetical protein